MTAQRLLQVDYEPESQEIIVRLRARRVSPLSEETRGHLHTAMREALLALQTLLQRDPTAADSPSGQPARARPRRQRIRVDGG